MQKLLCKEKLFDVDQKYLCFDSSRAGKWVKKSLPDALGETEFLTAQICPNVSLTHSKCEFDEHYRCTIRYPEATTLLVFGLKGYSSFGFSTSKLTHVVRAGDVWLINLENAPLYRFTPANTFNEMVVVKYETNRLNQAFNGESTECANILDNANIIRLGHQESVTCWVDKLLKNCLDSPTDRLLAESQALELIAKWMSPAGPVLQANNSEISPENLKRLNEVVEYLVSDLARTTSLMDLAKNAGMSHTKLNRYFKKIYGATVFSWLRTYRLERSRHYLHDQSRSITHIAFQCGFSSASHFAQAFKECYHCTPAEFRQQIAIA